MSSYETLVRFDEAIDEFIVQSIERKALARWALREMLKDFERGTVTRLEAACVLDKFEEGELRDPVAERLRIEVRDEARAVIADYPAADEWEDGTCLDLF